MGAGTTPASSSIHDVTAEHVASAPQTERTERRVLGSFALGTTFAAATWIGAALLMAGRGLDITDEGFYLLSYRWWAAETRTFTGAQYIYGPVFELLNWDIRGLRIFRLGTVVAAHLTFGCNFMTWLRLQRPNAPRSRLWEYAGTASIVASGGVVYGWLPLTPGYNDVVLLGSLFSTSIVLCVARRVGQGLTISWWLPAAWGPVIVSMFLAKWASTIVTLSAVCIALIVVLRPRGSREVVRFGMLTLASTSSMFAVVHALVIPLDAAVPEMIMVNSLVAAQTNSPVSLLRMYLTSGADVVIAAAAFACVPLLLVVLTSKFRFRFDRVGAILAVSVMTPVWVLIYEAHGFAGGVANISRFTASLTAMFLIVGGIGIRVGIHKQFTTHHQSRRHSAQRSYVAVLALLLVLPCAQAAGTGNPLYAMAVHAFSAWTALGTAIVTGVLASQSFVRGLAVLAYSTGIGLCAVVGTDALLNHPYRTTGYSASVMPVHGVPALKSVLLSPTAAQGFRALHQGLQQYIRPAGRPIMAFDEMPGVVFLLDGRSVGEAWYSRADPARSINGIVAGCKQVKAGDGRMPVLLFNRPASSLEVDALRTCGIDLLAEYKELRMETHINNLHVFVPKNEVSTW